MNLSNLLPWRSRSEQERPPRPDPIVEESTRGFPIYRVEAQYHDGSDTFEATGINYKENVIEITNGEPDVTGVYGLQLVEMEKNVIPYSVLQRPPIQTKIGRYEVRYERRLGHHWNVILKSWHRDRFADIDILDVERVIKE